MKVKLQKIQIHSIPLKLNKFINNMIIIKFKLFIFLINNINKYTNINKI